jgi:hypothetical protein
MGISQNYPSTMQHGTVEIGAEILLRIGREFGKRVEWLLTGKGRIMIPPTYKPKKKFMQLAIAEAERARDRGDYPIDAVITQLIESRDVVIASAGNRVKSPDVYQPAAKCDSYHAQP